MLTRRTFFAAAAAAVTAAALPAVAAPPRPDLQAVARALRTFLAENAAIIAKYDLGPALDRALDNATREIDRLLAAERLPPGSVPRRRPA